MFFWYMCMQWLKQNFDLMCFFPVNYPGRVQTRPFFIGICDRAYFRYFIELLNFASVIALVNASRILGKNMFLIEDIFIAALSADFWHIF
jgi:hypothetical protein